MINIVFWFFVVITITAALMVVLSKNLVYAAIALLITFLGVAAMYIFLWADFMAGAQVMIYIGGILILLLFGIMLTHKITSVRISHTNVQKGVGALVVVAIFVGLVWMVNITPWLNIPAQEPVQTVRDIGILLMTDFLLPLEAICILLLGALIGAAVLARKES
ncbi:MAG: NADH-quinone oxidoreductase subunit J [Planctomycetia bacterium]|nr:NADH-quinone oxidoreductase subunit J [Planctomycetia bacterium]